jgi:hypothetical protein
VKDLSSVIGVLIQHYIRNEYKTLVALSHQFGCSLGIRRKIIFWIGDAGAIRRKKSKDTLILAGVITGCTLFLIIYWLSK